MESFVQMINIQTVLFIYLAVGILCRKIKIISEESTQNFVDFALVITLPCMIFNSFSMDLTWDKLPNAVIMLVTATVVSTFSYLIGKIIYNRYPPGEKTVMHYGTCINNSGFVGLPMIASAFSDEVLMYSSIFIIPNRITMWTVGISLFTNAPLKQKVKKVLTNPCLIACALGVVRMLFALHLPPLLDTAIHTIGECSTPLSMIIVGAILADVDWRTVFQKSVFVLAFVRLLLLPLLFAAAYHMLGINGEVYTASVLLVGMPIGTTTVILAQKYGGSTIFASKCVFVSTLLSFLTVPLLTLLL